MTEAAKKVESPLLIQLSADDLRQIVREAVKSASRGAAEDRLIDVKEAAKILSVTPDWIYHHAKRLPFARKLDRKVLRFSVNGIQQYIEAKRLRDV
jgi:predicted DNA-binding transcriptional regulator AlpA